MPDLPPWLQTGPRDFVAAGQRGMQAGLEAARTQQAGDIAARNAGLEGQRIAQSAAAEQAQIAMHQQQLAQQEKQHAIAAQAEQEQAQRDFQIKQQQQNIASAYHEATIGIQKSKLEDARQVSARKFAAQQKLQQLTSAGVPFDKAILQVDPVLWSTGTQTELMKSATKTGTQNKMSDIDAQDRRLAISRYQKAMTALSTADPQVDKNDLINERQSARREMDRIAAKYTGGGQTQTGTAPGKLPTVTSQQEFDSLPPGSIYTDENGKRHQKPGQPGAAAPGPGAGQIPLESYGNTVGFSGNQNPDVPAE